MKSTVQHPVESSIDLRDMVRQDLIERNLKYLSEAEARRSKHLKEGTVLEYGQSIRQAVSQLYGKLPCGKDAPPVKPYLVSSYDKADCRIENVLFDSFPGWQVNATVYIPIKGSGPFPAVVIGVGHSGKQFESYQLPAQYFARCGYIVVTFDPPGQASEKIEGNDHFVDGIRCYLIGETSSKYFVADALRCVDYLATRKDVDMSRGVAMTGVSGGGMTTILAGLLDDRITVLGPSCCVTPLADLEVKECYASCPETHMFGRFAQGLDNVDLLCAASPKPVLFMNGEKDEVFHIDTIRRLANIVKDYYQTAGHAESFAFFVDPGGHGYSLLQAQQFVQFMNRHLLKKNDFPVVSTEGIAMHPFEECRCYPRTDVNIQTLTLARAQELQTQRKITPEQVHKAAMKLAGVSDEKIAIPKAQSNPSFQVFTHYWQQLLLNVEPEIELPATFLYNPNSSSPVVLHFDDQHRNRLLHRQGPLAVSIGFLGDSQKLSSLFSVDLRGWGDSSPAMYPYEMVGWGGVDRYLSYISFAAGDSLMAMRIRDGLATLAYVRSLPQVEASRIVLTGSGLGGIVALHVAAIDQKVQGVVIWDYLSSYIDLLKAKQYTWPADAFMPNILLHYDLPELANAISSPVTITNPLDGEKMLLDPETAEQLYGSKVRTFCYPTEPVKNLYVAKSIQTLLEYGNYFLGKFSMRELSIPGVKGDGIHDDTDGLQAALDSGSGMVYLPKPPKKYIISRTLKIHSNQVLKLDRYAVIQLKDQTNDEMLANSDYDGGNENIWVEGGIWNGNNTHQTRGNTQIDRYDENLFTGSVFRFNHVRNLEISNVTIKDPESFGMQIGNITRFTIENILFDYNMLRLNMDGVHCNGPCEQGKIKNLQGATNDDMVALNADDGAWGEMTRGPIRDIVIDTLTCENGYTGVRLLSAGSPVSRVWISNVLGTYRYYVVSFTHHEVHPGALSRFEDISIDRILCSKPVNAPKTGLFWMQGGVEVTNLNIRNYLRTESNLNAPDILIDSGVVVGYLGLSDFSVINKTDEPITLLQNSGTINNLNMVNMCLQAEKGKPRGCILENHGKIIKLNTTNIVENDLAPIEETKKF